jgi:osmotically-inducible protein OsmY
MVQIGQKIKRQLLGAMICAPLALSACTPIGVATGVGATAGIAAAKEGGIRQSVRDAQISATINDLWFKHDVEMFRKANLTVEQGRVLVTGVVQDPEHRVEAIRLAWQAPHVKQVINEIQVTESEGVSGYVRDGWITAQLRTAILLDRDVSSINYTIDTVQGVVYLMGNATDQQELNRVMERARTTKYVRQVVSYVKMLGEPVIEAGTNLDVAP